MTFRYGKISKLSRRLAAILSCVCLLAVLLAGCGDKGGATRGEKGSEESEESSSQSIETTESGETPGGNGQTVPTMSTEEMYQGFLDGTERVYCDNREYTFYDSVADAEVKFFSDKNGYTLKEFVREIQEILDLEPDISIRITAVNWAMMDWGNDGEPELALEVITDGDLWEEGDDYQFGIKNIDGKLQICYRTVSAYRSYNYFENRYGLVSDNYYWGMGYGSTTGWLDANGEYHFLYGVSSDAANYVYDGEGGLADALNKIAEREGDEYLFESFQVLQYRLKEYEEGENEKEVYRYTYEYYGGENYDDEPDEHLKSLFLEAFDTAGFKLYSWEEINDILKQRQKECGLTPEMALESDEEFTWTAMEKDEFWPGKVTTVKTADEFMAAIESNAIIYLEPGTYDLTKWLQSDNRLNTVPQYMYSEDYDSYNADGVLYGGYDDESWEIVVNRVRNLVITSADPANPARIVCDCPMAVVLNFRNCSFVELDNVIMGHEVEPGHCSGDVVGIYGCNVFDLNGCDLYGCGAHAFDLTKCNGVTVKDCVIHDCTYGCMTAYNPGYVCIYDTVFENCREYDMFSIYYGDVYFSGCTFRNLNGNMMWLDENSYVSFYDCQFDVRALESLQGNDVYGSRIQVY